ncbi:MAG: radical SAM family heme chaperone HemW [Deltaproteobacteria bacterium]|nr:radical SAM family heme chaperone HemW [Deltaproteobacteria bacterium]MBZ0219456.1 radical SAM family heme chaperone HemW [Deltaproteobacteria bacterium]
MGLLGKKEEGIGVYAHIPFCLSKCPYCAFNSVAAKDAAAYEERYVECLVKELGARAGKENIPGPLRTFYIGGGTPTLFSPEAIGKLLTSAIGIFGIGNSHGIESTIEANPDTLTPSKLAGYRRHGVNRLSIGFQSLDDARLAALGRTHTASRAAQAFKWGRDAGFENIGIDLIFGTPGQDPAGWQEELSSAALLKPEHISLYGMTIEEGTPFYRRYGPGKTGLPGEDAESEMFSAAVKTLKSAGYRHYEVSNFALPGRESVHNSLYWKGAPYIGVGAGAHSYLPWPGWGRRWWNETRHEEYMGKVEADLDPSAGGEELGRDEAMIEAVMLGLRMVDGGVNGERFKEKFGCYPGAALPGLEGLIKEGLVRKRGEDVLVTESGLLLLNEVAARML